jgi:hypothetical protein
MPTAVELLNDPEAEICARLLVEDECPEFHKCSFCGGQAVAWHCKVSVCHGCATEHLAPLFVAARMPQDEVGYERIPHFEVSVNELLAAVWKELASELSYSKGRGRKGGAQ